MNEYQKDCANGSSKLIIRGDDVEKGQERDDDDHNVVEDNDNEFHILDEGKQLLSIAMPAVMLQFNMMLIFIQGASVVGQMFGETALAGFSLGTLVANMTYLSVVVGSLSAADTLMPRSYGSGNYPEIGMLAVRGTIVCCIFLIPAILVFIQPGLMKYILVVLLHQDAAASIAASHWIQYYLIGTPANLIFRVITSFLVAQKAAWPSVYASLLPTFVLNPILLQILVPRYGLSGSALAISITQWFCLLFLILYVRFRPSVYEPGSWPGFSLQLLKDAIDIQPMIKFASLSAGGVLSLSEWWFWEVMCFVAGSFGVLSLCAHTIAYNLVPLSFMLPLGISIGLVVRMGSTIATNPVKAKKMARYTMAFAVVAGSILVAFLWFFQVQIIKLFTNEEEVVRESQAIWPMVCYHIWLLNIFGINGGICKALGMQWTVATYVFVCLWCLTLPATFWFAVHNNGGLRMEWYIMPSAYTIMQFGLVYSYTSMDWDQRSKDIRTSIARLQIVLDLPEEMMNASFASETTSLLV